MTVQKLAAVPAVTGALMLCASVALAQDPCVVPDNGGGTVTLPPEGCAYLSPDEVHMIIDGLPPGTTIELAPIHRGFICKQGMLPQEACNSPGGSLGGEVEVFESVAEFQLVGTGALAGYTRTLQLPVFCEVHTGPRNPGDAVQTFDNEMVVLQGQLFGDPDFQQLSINAGSAFGLPSPGQTTLTRLGPPGSDYQVDSFFDIVYQIDFQGAPGGPLDGMSGTTTATVRVEAQGLPTGCAPLPDGSACNPDVLCDPDGVDRCFPVCANYDPLTGETRITACNCQPPDACRLVVGGLPGPTAGGSSGPCVLPDNGGGTVTLPPPGCPYLSPADAHRIIDGLPPGTEIIVDAAHDKFFLQNSGPGGNLGGEVEQFSSILFMNIQGTGDLAGFNRFIAIPIQCETHTGPRNPGDPVQVFPNDMFSLEGELFGDPDFCQLRIRGGTAFGLPSPGETRLTRLGPPGSNYNVDSFFDVAYEIEWQGCPGSALDGLRGVSPATVRMATGAQPVCVGQCPPGTTCQQTTVVAPDGTIDICCECVPDTGGDDCEPVPGFPGCNPNAVCPDPDTQVCRPKCISVNATGGVDVVVCDCVEFDNDCWFELDPTVPTVAGAGGNPCQVPDDGTGTVTLPPAGCAYLSPNEVHEIIDGLPAGTTIELDPIHRSFICKTSGQFPGCPPPGQCERPGGALGGQVDCFMSTLELNVSGTGALAGFNRTLFLPLECQVHTAPRIPGELVQTFETEFWLLQGQLVGDPDFEFLSIRGGSGFGLPSPGQTTLTRLNGNFNVDSFFDITYEIEFQGAPGGPLEGMDGVTTATIRMTTGTAIPPCKGNCPPGTICRQNLTDIDGDGTLEICCECVPCPADPCPGDVTGDGVVGVNDLLAVLGGWGMCPAPCTPGCNDPVNCPGDANDDCVVDITDLLLVLGNWGPCFPTN